MTALTQVARRQPRAGKVGPANGFGWLRCGAEIVQNNDDSIRETCKLETHLAGRRCLERIRSLDRIRCLERIRCLDRIRCLVRIRCLERIRCLVQGPLVHFSNDENYWGHGVPHSKLNTKNLKNPSWEARTPDIEVDSLTL
jgi:hypothetical protein